MTADLHLHTYYSDGNWSPAEVVDAAIKFGFQCMAITDHDTVAGLDEAREAAADHIRLIDGIEMNCIWVNPDGERQDVHILGYFIDKASPALKDAMDKQQEARMNYVRETLDRLREKGHKIELDDVISAAGKGSIGRPHVCAAMLKAGVTRDIQNAYRMLMNRDSEYRVIRRSITPQDAIKAIRAAGGISSLAHPGKDDFIPELVKELQDSGLQAIEAYHRGHTNTQVRKYLKLARDKGMLATGGSDCHGPYKEYPATIGTVRIPPDIVKALDAFRETNAAH